jgi:hypothetical protein
MLRGVGAPPFTSESRCLYTVSVDPCGLRKGKILAGYRWVLESFPVVLPLVGDGPLIERTAAITGVPVADTDLRVRELEASLPGALLMSELSRTVDFEQALVDVQHALSTSEPFLNALKEDAGAYVDRVARRGDLALPLQRATELSREYLTHEVAMYLCQARQGYLVDAYVGGELPVLKKFMSGEMGGLLTPLERRIFIGLSPEDA